MHYKRGWRTQSGNCIIGDYRGIRPGGGGASGKASRHLQHGVVSWNTSGVDATHTPSITAASQEILSSSTTAGVRRERVLVVCTRAQTDSSLKGACMQQ